MYTKESLEVMKVTIALELGIVPPGFDIKESLSKMEEEEARKSKRKFRKIKRKIVDTRYGATKKGVFHWISEAARARLL